MTDLLPRLNDRALSFDLARPVIEGAGEALDLLIELADQKVALVNPSKRSPLVHGLDAPLFEIPGDSPLVQRRVVEQALALQAAFKGDVLAPGWHEFELICQNQWVASLGVKLDQLCCLSLR